jgi:hypothetical protein
VGDDARYSTTFARPACDARSTRTRARKAPAPTRRDRPRVRLHPIHYTRHIDQVSPIIPHPPFVTCWAPAAAAVAWEDDDDTLGFGMGKGGARRVGTRVAKLMAPLRRLWDRSSVARNEHLEKSGRVPERRLCARTSLVRSTNSPKLAGMPPERRLCERSKTSRLPTPELVSARA